MPPHRQAVAVVRHAMATVHNFNGDQNNQHDNTSQRFAKTKELQSQHTKPDTRLQHICFCPNAPCPPTTPKTDIRAYIAHILFP